MKYLSRRTAAALVLLSAATSGVLNAQTQLDLRTQTKSVDFQNATLTRPMRTASTLPSTCSDNEMVFLTSAPAGSNLYACISGTWVPEAASQGTLTVQNGGTNVGARQTQNFVPGTGIVNVITDLGNKLNIQQTVDTSTIVSKTGLQSGSSVFCLSVGDTPPNYSCALSPALTTYTQGMVVNWTPSANGTTGATTLNINLLGATPVRRTDGVTAATGTDIVNGRMYPVWFDGTAFRLPSAEAAGGSSGGSSGPPTTITSTGAGGPTTVTATSEWHAPLAICVTGTGAVLTWNPPPGSGVAPVGAGCAGTEVNEAYASFGTTASSLQTSFILPKNLTGTADVSLYYVPAAAAVTFTPTLELVCTPSNGTVVNEGAFSGSFFAPGVVTGPGLSGSLAAVSATALTWPTNCVGGSRAHLRLARTAGGTGAVNMAELVITLRRVM